VEFKRHYIEMFDQIAEIEPVDGGIES